jgi:hypothetical protein
VCDFLQSQCLALLQAPLPNNTSSLNFDGFTRPPVVRPWGVRWRARVPYPCSLNVPSLQDAGPMGDQNPMAYVHKGGVRILSYLALVWPLQQARMRVAAGKCNLLLLAVMIVVTVTVLTCVHMISVVMQCLAIAAASTLARWCVCVPERCCLLQAAEQCGFGLVDFWRLVAVRAL